MLHSPARIVLVTGGSRGIGAEVAQQLAGGDTHVVVNYRQSAERAEAVAEVIPGARYVEVRTGHYMAVQTPELISDCIEEFLRTVGA